MEGNNEDNITTKLRDKVRLSEKDPHEEYIFEEKLGEGLDWNVDLFFYIYFLTLKISSYGSVWRIKDKNTNEEFAMKQISVENNLKDLLKVISLYLVHF